MSTYHIRIGVSHRRNHHYEFCRHFAGSRHSVVLVKQKQEMKSPLGKRLRLKTKKGASFVVQSDRGACDTSLMADGFVKCHDNET